MKKQPPQKKPILIVHGDRGGVGKSKTMALIVAQIKRQNRGDRS